MRSALAGILALLVLAGARPAMAQMDSREGIALQNQILELRRDIQSLRDQTGRGGGGGGGGSSLGSASRSTATISGGGDLTATLLGRVNELEDQVRALRGKVDESENARQRMAEDLGKQIDDLNFKLNNGGSGAPASRSGAAPTTLSPPPGNLAAIGAGTGAAAAAPAAPVTQPPARRTQEMAMQEGNAALARRDYATAESAAHEVLAGPKSPRAIDAQFLLAQALYGKKDMSNAAVAYDDAYNRSRTGPHAQDSLLGLANSLTNIGEKRAACATLDKLKAEFPTPRPDLHDSIAGARQRAGCH
jgi:TolA-binding protein